MGRNIRTCLKSRREVGRKVEARARGFLESRGLKLIAQNYVCRSGELDLVMLDDDVLVIVEVRYRSRDDFVSAQESVDWRKQKRLARATEHFLLGRSSLQERPIRFDVVAVAGDDEETMRWIRGAFEA
ncbi:YraN family protein [soil metagenome]